MGGGGDRTGETAKALIPTDSTGCRVASLSSRQYLFPRPLIFNPDMKTKEQTEALRRGAGLKITDLIEVKKPACWVH